MADRRRVEKRRLELPKRVLWLAFACSFAAFGQDPTQCIGSKGPSDGQTFSSSGGASSFSGTVSTACGQLTSAVPGDPWISITSASTFVINFSVAPNATNATRSGSVTANFANAAGGPVSFTFNLTEFGALGLTSSGLPGGKVGDPYNGQLEIDGGDAPYQFSLISGTLPPNLQLNPNTGVITGTPAPDTQGSYPLTIRVTDQLKNTLNVPVTLIIAPAPLVIVNKSLTPATEGTFYSVTFTATGGTPQYSWSVSGQPTWLSMSNGGVLSGTPPIGSAGTYPITVTVKDSASVQTSAGLSLKVNPLPLAIVSTSPLPDGKEGSLYGFAFQAFGGKGPYKWTQSGLPGLFSFSTTGNLSGTPPLGSAGTYPFSVTVTDFFGTQVSKGFSLNIDPFGSGPSALSIVNTSLPAATEGIFYDVAFAATGGTPSYTWSVSGQPLWLSMSTSGLLSGTPPIGSAGTYPITVTVKDSASTQGSTSGTFSLQVNPAQVNGPLTIASLSPLPDGKEGSLYGFTFQATGGKAPYKWTATGLPTAFLNLATTTGILSGTPPSGSAGPYSFTVFVTDSVGTQTSKLFNLKIDQQGSGPGPLMIVNTSLPPATEGIFYSVPFTATGGTPTYSWSASGQPKWLNMSAVGQLSGTPPIGSAGSYSFTVTVMDSQSGSTSAAFTLQVNAVPVNSPLTIASLSPLPDGKEGSLYAFNFQAIGGKAPYKWTATGLPEAGLNLATTGTLSGTPPVGSAGPYTFTVIVTDSVGTQTSKPFTVMINPLGIGPGPLSIVNKSLPPATETIFYSVAFIATGGTPAYKWTASGQPIWLTMSAPGQLSGTPPVGSAGTYPFTVTVMDSGGLLTSAAVSLQVNAVPVNAALTIASLSPLPDGQEASPYKFTFQAIGGVGPYKWTATGLPVANLNLATNGIFSGTPPIGSAGPYSFTVYVTDFVGTQTNETFTLNIDPVPVIPGPLSIVNTALPAATEGLFYSDAFSANGGTPPYSWSASGQPFWLPMSTAGVFSGTPPFESAGTYPFITVTVTDSASVSTSRTYSLTVNPSPVIGPLEITSGSPLPDGREGNPYNFNFQATGGTGPYKWTLTGLSTNLLNLATSGSLNGTPPAGSAGSYSFIVIVTDSTGLQTTKPFSLTINPAGVNPQPLSIVNAPLAPAYEQIFYSTVFTARGGTPAYRWSASGQPKWLSMSSGGVLSGIPPAGSAGNYPFTVIVNDAASGVNSLSVSLQVKGPIEITSVSPLADGKETNPYNFTFQAKGGQGAYTWTATGLPTQFLNLASNGNLTGTPPIGAAGPYTFTVTVTDSAMDTTSQTFMLTVDSLITITVSSPLQQAKEGQPYSFTFSASGGMAPYTWTAVGLPGWASFPSTGVLSGTPPIGAAGGVKFTVTAKDSQNDTQSKQFTLVVLAANGGVTITNPSPLPDAAVGIAYLVGLTATGGATPYQWFATGLPDGITLGKNSGLLSGTPTTGGDYTLTAQVTDANNKVAFAVLGLHVASPGLAISTSQPLPGGIVSVPYSTLFLSSGGTRPQSWTVVSGSLPPGLSLDTNGQITGTPTQMGVFDFTVGVAEVAQSSSPNAIQKRAAPATASAPFQIAVEAFQTPDLVLSCGSLQFQVPGNGAAPSQTCSVISTIYNSIPFTTTVNVPGITVVSGGITPSTIDISIDPATVTPGNYTGIVTVTSPGLPPKTIDLSLNVNPTPGTLLVSPQTLSFSPDGSQGTTSSIFVQNDGQTPLTFTVSSDVPWLQVSTPSATLAPGALTVIQVTLVTSQIPTSGYLGTISIDSDSGSTEIPASVIVSARAKMKLSRDGILLQARQGNGVSGPSPESFTIASSDSTEIHYTVQQIGGNGWLTVTSNPTGTATNKAFGVVTFTAKSGGLPKGAYYAIIRITAPEPRNGLLDFLVVLDVEDASTPPVPDTYPSGLVFNAATAAGLAAQTVDVYTSNDAAIDYQVAVQSSGPTSWLSVTPTGGQLATLSPAQLRLSADPSGLKPGIYRGGVNVSISNLEVRTINVTMIVPAAAAPSASASASTEAGRTIRRSDTSACTPSNLVLTETGLAGNFSTPAAWPSYIAAQLSDDCGNIIADGNVTAQFSNGDPPLTLAPDPTASGQYSVTWTPVNPVTELTITLNASGPQLNQTSIQVLGGVTSTPYPILAQNSTVNNFYQLGGAPLAPGTIVAIYGTSLAPGTQSAGNQLTTELNGTSVIIGGELAPLFFVSPTQINAQLPTDLVPNQQYQVLVYSDGAYSSPDTITIDAASPGVSHLTNGQAIAQHQDFSSVTADSPAKPGEYLVIYLAGMGLTDTPVDAGTPSPSSPLDSVTIPPTVTLDGESVSTQFAGLAPGMVGIYQINFQVPSDAKTGSLTLQVSQMGAAANASVLIVGN